MSVADELEKLALLKEKGVLTTEEFENEKLKLLDDKNATETQSIPAAPNDSSEAKKGMSTIGKVAIGIVVAVGAFLAFGAIIGNTPEAKAQRQDEEAIKLCWKEQARKSLAPGAQRFAASVCEKMEGDYRQQYGRNP